MLFKRTKKQPKSDHVTVTLPQVKQAIRKFEEDILWTY